MTRVDDNELEMLRGLSAPAPDAEARARALNAAMAAFDENISSAATQGSAGGLRLTERAQKLWSEMMQKKLLATPALAGLVALPLAGYATFYLLENSPFSFGGDHQASDGPAVREQDKRQDATSVPHPAKEKKADADAAPRDVTTELLAKPATPPKAAEKTEVGHLYGKPMETEAPATTVAPSTVAPAQESSEMSRDAVAGLAAPAPEPKSGTRRVMMDIVPESTMESRGRVGAAPGTVAASKMMAPNATAGAMPSDMLPPQEENRDRFEEFKTNPVKSALEDPVSTFSIDVDTAS